MDARTAERLEHWLAAGLLDAAAADRIRQYELSQTKPAGVRWQVMLALAFGAILLGSGVALFVAAHWDALSPLARLSIALALVVVFHALAGTVRPRFEGLAIALHSVGTIAAGAAVFLVGQIFNIQEDWAGGVLLWALCAAAGWLLLRDQGQQTTTLLLVPAWVLSEWWYRTSEFRWAGAYQLRMVAVFAALYVTVFLGSRKKFVATVCFLAGAIALLVSIPLLTDGSIGEMWHEAPALPLAMRVVGWLLIAVLPLAAAVVLKRASVIPVAVVLLVAAVLPHAHRTMYGPGGQWAYLRPTLVSYALPAALAVFFAWWGVRQNSRALINLGVLGFALTVLWFYFSDVMGKLGRSFSLMLLGVIFLGGGWLLERLRRRLVAQVGAVPKEAA